MEDKPVGKAVYKAIAAVQGEMATIGISKDSRNQQQGFMFRGIDAVYNALAPLLAKHKLCIIPKCQSRTQTERESKSGGALFSVVLDVEYDVVSGEDGSCHTARLPAEAMDSADKATNKAMSAAYKYLCLQMFCIPTEGESPDADKESHEVKGKPQTKEEPKPKHNPHESGAMAPKQGLSATGNIIKIFPPNAGGYVAVCLEGYEVDGRDMRFATKSPEDIAIIEEADKNGSKVHLDYNTTQSGKFTNYNITKATEIKNEVPF